MNTRLNALFSEFFTFKPVRLKVFLAWLFFAFLCSFPSDAQITKTSRLELNDSKSSFDIGSYIYLTEDPNNQLTASIIASRHEQNLRGEKQDSRIVNLGFAPQPSWLLFSVTNMSREENWILDFGKIFDGRYGLAKRIEVINYTDGETFLDTEQSTAALKGTAVPVKIGLNKTVLFLIFLDMDGGLPSTIAPQLVTEKTYTDNLIYGDRIHITGLILILGAGIFFAAVSYLQKNRVYILFSTYYFIHIAFLQVLNNQFFTAYALHGEAIIFLFAAATLLSLFITRAFLLIGPENHTANMTFLATGILIVICALFNALLLSGGGVLSSLLVYASALLGLGASTWICLVQGQSGKITGLYLASAWFCVLLGALLTGLVFSGLISAHVLLINAYWLSLIPQLLFLATATSKKIELLQEEQRNLQARESRAAQSLARLKQSKESADQTRLLRVIERERELMAELREREMQRTEEMRRAKEMADEANRAKSAFLAVVSHEIRTPMTGIMGVVRLLKDTKMNKDQMDYLLAIQKSGDTMMALLNDILDFEKIETGRMEMESISFDLLKLLQGVVTLMSGHAADKNIYLKLDISPDFPRFLMGDPTRLRQVLLNLVSNALKFTERGGVTVHLKALPQGQTHDGKERYEIYFGVQDTGIGIPEEAQENLFNAFRQADKSVTRKYGGSGLGLAICQRLVEAMGGSIRFNSERNVGSTFFFSLAMTAGSQHGSDDGEDMQSRLSAFNIPPMKILVIEDNEINRKVLQSFLEKDGHAVTLCDRGENAIEILKDKKFDIIFTDIRLPGMSGIETAKTIRTLPDRKLASTPIVALTGNVAQEDIDECYSAGINDFIGKPIDYDKLTRMLSDTHSGRFKPLHQDRDEPLTPVQEYARQEELAAPAEPQEAPPVEPAEDIAPVPVEKKPTSLRFEDDEDPLADIDPAQVFDQKMLQSLLRSLGKPQMTELMNGFMDKAEEIATDLGQAAPDAQLYYERGHELKGMAANFGMKELAQSGTKIEKAGQTGNIAQGTAEAKKLPGLVHRAKFIIKDWLNSQT